MPKPIHLLRTTRPDLTAGFVEELERIHLLILESLFRFQINPVLFNLLSLSTGLGGIGIQKICEIRPAAYAASYLCFLQRTGFSNETLQSFIHSLSLYKLHNKEIYSNPTKDLPEL
jgi:hypothetical protein